MPAFLDGARLPDLQEAWRAHFSDPNETAIVRRRRSATTEAEAALKPRSRR